MICSLLYNNNNMTMMALFSSYFFRCYKYIYIYATHLRVGGLFGNTLNDT